MSADSGAPIEEIRVDGGMVGNDFLMQFLADITGRTVTRPAVQETTALGAAYLAGLAVGYWGGQEELRRLWAVDRNFEPQMDGSRRQELLHGWHRAVERARGWVEPPQLHQDGATM
jgi:glycerol kinase